MSVKWPFSATCSIMSSAANPLSLASFSKVGLNSANLSLSITFLWYAIAKSGSTPLEHSEIILIVPVGAIVVNVIFLNLGCSDRL